ncbi:hypothetical protein BJ944DRAFT_245175 [Cunninghamella echinulata]|nr:hypothetical protein BJ944DRAFT_245175 [Cunninghamella echinulata]
MKLNQLPNEIILCILSQLPSHHVRFFLQTCRCFYTLKYDDDFWRCLITIKYGITYRHPSLSWYQLAISNEINKMCPHLYNPWHYPNHHIIDQLSFIIQSKNNRKNICCNSSSSSSSFGCGDVFFKDKQKDSGHLFQHYQSTHHSLILKVSNINYLEMWCYTCNRPLGYWGTANDKIKLASSEIYMVRQWMQYILWSITLPSSPHHHNVSRQLILHKQRQLELQLLFSTSETPCYFLDSQWFYSWMKSLVQIKEAGESDIINYPLSISPQHDFFFNQQTHALKPHLKLNLHFVLVTGQIYCYIQRIYGINGPTIHKGIYNM